MFGRCHSRGSYYSQRSKQDYGYGWRRPKYNVPVNIADKTDHFELKLYTVGFEKDNIKVSVVDDVLYLSGTRDEPDVDQLSFIKQEYPVKSFERMISLNGQINTQSISAKVENGMLIVILPKTPEAQKPATDIKVE